jgi:hypothetical protein
MSAGSLGVSVAQTALGASTFATGAAIVAGTAVSATGIGLAATAAALTLGGMALGARSAYATNRHINRLVELSTNQDTVFRCVCLSTDPRHQCLHDVIKNDVLPYIIHQKRKKLGRKAASAAGGGLLVGLYTGIRSLAKSNKGVERAWNAETLAVHFLTSRCELASAIIAELFSMPANDPRVDELRSEGMDSDTLSPLLMDKMKST